MTPKRLQILQPLTSKPWPLITVACRHFASSSVIKTNHKPNPPKQSLYQMLFPKDLTPKPTKASPSHSDTTSPNDDLEPPRISLQDDHELGEWMKQLHFNFLHNSKTNTKDGETDIPTVLILSAPRDLLESDFYRVSPTGQHVQGWTSGPDKVVQSRSPNHLTTHELYYLFFPSRPSATYYLSILKHQHSLARSSLLSVLSSPSPPHLPPSNPLPYSLIPPHIPTITSSLHPLSSLISSYFSHTLPKSNQATLTHLALFQPLFPALSSSSSSSTSATIDEDDPLPQQNFVLLRLHNGKLPQRALCHFIYSDATSNRNGLRWALMSETQQERYRTIQMAPLRSTMSYAKLPESYQQQQQQQQQQVEGRVPGRLGYKGEKKGEIKVYSRFILGFEHPAEAKRFARCWHKRELVDEVRGQRLVCNTTVLW